MGTGKQKERKSGTPRVSVSLSPDVHATLEQIAQEKKVSVAWVMRDAVEQYIAAKWPLFSQNRRGKE